MKKYNNYINEKIKPFNRWNVDQVHLQPNQIIEIDKIFNECSDYIDIVKDSRRLLWRGLKKSEPTQWDDHETILELYPQQNRKPRDTPKQIHNILDNVLFEKFGWYPRSTGVFAFESINLVRQYGEPYMIFPVNGYKYIWSPDINDFYIIFTYNLAEMVRWFLKHGDINNKKEVDEVYNQNKSSLNNKWLKSEDRITLKIWRKMMTKEWLTEKIKKMTTSYIDTDLKKLLKMKTSNEIMIKCDKYYAITGDAYHYIKKRLDQLQIF
jgi:hypothetical protein